MDLNCDMGEGGGLRPAPGQGDAAIMPLITSASIACGFHAGDPSEMRRTILLAARHGVSIGAHPGYADRDGFGRRPMNLGRQELIDLIVYQVGALQTMALSEGCHVDYVKPHGALYNQAEEDPKTAAAVVEAVRGAGRGFPLALVVSAFSAVGPVAEMAGVRVVREVFADRGYAGNGRLLPRDRDGAVLTDPGRVAARVVEMVKTSTVTAVTGETLPVVFETICFHGDTPGATGLARAARAALGAAGVGVARFV